MLRIIRNTESPHEDGLVGCVVDQIETVFEAIGCDFTFVYRLSNNQLVEDETTKILLLDRSRRCRAIMIISSEVEPESVGEASSKAAAARAAVGGKLKSTVAVPLRQGDINGRTFAIYAYHQPMTAKRWIWKIQKRLISPRLLKWLDDVAVATVAETTTEPFLAQLSALSRFPGMSAEVQTAGDKAASDLEAGVVPARHVLMHGDLWKDNVLIHNEGFAVKRLGWISGEPVLIDWGASLVSGFGMYDLMRLCQSMRVPTFIAQRHLRRQAGVLGGGARCAETHLLAALGSIAATPGYVQPERVVKVCDDMLGKYRSIAGTSDNAGMWGA